jgi:hemoglobin
MKAPLAALACACVLSACHGATPGAAPAPVGASPAETSARPSLYTRLGGVDAIRAVVGDFLGRVAADTRINAFFRGVDTAELAAKLTDQICQATGGPCRYAGKSMRAAHADMRITDADFDALVEDLAASLDHFSVGPTEERELLTALGGLRGQIVTRR